LKVKGLRLFGYLFGGFSVAFRFLALLLKTYDNKAPPTPCLSTLLSTLPLTHPPSTLRCIKALKNKHLLDVSKALKIKELMRGFGSIIANFLKNGKKP
jgi:hypothetical protein